MVVSKEPLKIFISNFTGSFIQNVKYYLTDNY